MGQNQANLRCCLGPSADLENTYGKEIEPNKRQKKEIEIDLKSSQFRKLPYETQKKLRVQKIMTDHYANNLVKPGEFTSVDFDERTDSKKSPYR